VSPIGLGLAALGRPGYLNLCHGENLGERPTEADTTLWNTVPSSEALRNPLPKQPGPLREACGHAAVVTFHR
jgi:hypothetical protein